jgi:hypothetical protein
MKKFLFILFLFPLISFDTQQTLSYTSGEFIKMRIHYGFVNAGYATLEVKEKTLNNKNVFHLIGKGFTTGMTKLFFKVEDQYESYVDKVTGNPYKYIRKVSEGGFTIDEEGIINHLSNNITVKNLNKKTEKNFTAPTNVQDMLSAFYYLRNAPQINSIKVGESIAIDMFFDNSTTKFKLKFIGRQTISTKFGKVSCLVFKPLVQSGRVFKENESVTVWISDDVNKIPMKIKAELAVGSLNADIDECRGLVSAIKSKNE